MFTDLRTLKNLIHAALLTALPLFAGCGGGGGGDDAGSSDGNESTGTNPVLCIILILATGNTGCTESDNSSSPSSSPSTPPPSPSSGPLLHQNQELEPNSDLANANLPSYPWRSSPDRQIGWYVVGSINDVTDTTDVFAFTSIQTREYILALCPPEGSSCDGKTGIDTLTAFFRVLDQDGNVLYTSEADTDYGNRYRTTIDAGVLNYVTVDAGDTMGVTVDYRLFVYEIS